MPVVEKIFDNPHPIDRCNSSKRLPVVICLDVSGSMRNDIKELEEGLRLFLKECSEDEQASYCCETLILTFSETITVVQNFDTVSNITKDGIPSYNLSADGYTATGEAVKLGLRLLDERWDELSRSGCSSRFMPWLVIMSDGYPEGGNTRETAERMAALEDVSKELKRRVNEGRLTTFSIGVGKHNNKEVMDKLSPDRSSVHLQSFADGTKKFKDFFVWLSSSIRSASVRMPDEPIQVQPVTSWAEGWGSIATAPSTATPSANKWGNPL